jgi:hypothetical protein
VLEVVLDVVVVLDLLGAWHRITCEMVLPLLWVRTSPSETSECSSNGSSTDSLAPALTMA